jgi:AcrR family transcriptional regulator
VTTDKLSGSTLAQRAIRRPLTDRLNSAASDVERIIDATYRLSERTGAVDPTIREIVKESGLSTQAFYRYFSSKDELLVVIIDDGRRQLADYLEHRLSKQDTGRDRVVAWIEGMFAQAADPEASHRTRPFITNLYRLVEEHPEELQASVSAVVDLLEGAVADFAAEQNLADRPTFDDVMSIYHLTVARMEKHIVLDTSPTRSEVDGTIAFVFRAMSVDGVPT